MNKELLDFICRAAMEENNRIWNLIYDTLDEMGIVVPDYVEYESLWAWLAITYNVKSRHNDEPLLVAGSEDARDYEEMWAQYAE